MTEEHEFLCTCDECLGPGVQMPGAGRLQREPGPPAKPERVRGYRPRVRSWAAVNRPRLEPASVRHALAMRSWLDIGGE